MTVVMDEAELNAFLGKEFPQVKDDFLVEHVGDRQMRMRMHIFERNLRPGGTVSGPAIFSLADVSVYLCLLAMIGPEALAVTTNSSIDFMRKPAFGRDLISETRLLKLGRVLAVGDVLIFSEGDAEPAARATLTYSIPPKR